MLPNLGIFELYSGKSKPLMNHAKVTQSELTVLQFC
jgi:hypothetical protein